MMTIKRGCSYRIITRAVDTDAFTLVDTLSATQSQLFIEIRQDTRGVPELHALRRRSPHDETLELIYQ